MLDPCWKIKRCGREAGGVHEKELGPCPAHPNHGHSCWIVAGTECHDTVKGTFAKKLPSCVLCEVHDLYSPLVGKMKEEMERECPIEYMHCKGFFSRAQHLKTPPSPSEESEPSEKI